MFSVIAGLLQNIRLLLFHPWPPGGDTPPTLGRKRLFVQKRETHVARFFLNIILFIYIINSCFKAHGHEGEIASG